MESSSTPPRTFALHAGLTVLIGCTMAFQGLSNGGLSPVIGHGIYAATISFLGGFLVIALIALSTANNRRTTADVWRLGRSGEFPWWMMLGGLAGASVVISQSLTVPLFGVAVFTMSFICGQLIGGLAVDATRLAPGGRKPLTPGRILGTLVVMGGVSVSAWGVLVQGVEWWAPLLPACAGMFTALQQAFNGRLRIAAGSTVASTFTNFLTGSVFLLAASTVVYLLGTPITGFPVLPGQAWMLLGGLYGLLFIGYSAMAVGKLGVLLMSLFSLLGNLLGSLVIDLTIAEAAADVTWTTYLSMAIVVAGVLVTSLFGNRRR